MPTQLRKLAFLLCFTPCLMLIVGCQTIRAAEKRAAAYTISPSQETQLGTDYAAELETELTFIDDPKVQSWVDQVGARLVSNSPQCEQAFTFRVTTDPAINAFAIPGGYCYINAGLIAAADNEAQVVAVVGHEINHVTQRHGVLSMQRAMGADWVIGAVNDEAGGGPTLAQQVKQAGGVVVMRSFSREDEREADRLGVEAMYKAGWDPRQAADFFRILMSGESSGTGGATAWIQQILSTHPMTSERIENIETQVATYDLSDDLTVNTPTFQEVQAIVRKKVQ